MTADVNNLTTVTLLWQALNEYFHQILFGKNKFAI